MPKKIMKTLWDESAELENEILSTHSFLSDDYTSKDNDLEELNAKKIVDDDLKGNLD